MTLSLSLRSLVEVSLACAPVIAALLLLTPLLRRFFTARWRYLMWLLLAARLLVPVNITLPQPPLVVETPAYFTAPLPQAPAGPPPSGPAPQAGGAAAAPAPAGRALPAGRVAAAIWLAGAGAVLLWQLGAYAVLLRGVRRWGRAEQDAATLALFGRLCRETRVRGTVRLLRCQKIAGPLCCGFFRPRLVLPDHPIEAEALEMVLRHELVHCRRRDVWYQLLFTLATAAHWFNPLVWLLGRAARRDVEISCDDEVVRGQNDGYRRRYSEMILATAAGGWGAGALPTRLGATKRSLRQRLAAVLDRGRKHRGLPALAVVAAAAVAVGALVALSPRAPAPQGGAGEAPASRAPQEGKPQEGGRAAALLQDYRGRRAAYATVRQQAGGDVSPVITEQWLEECAHWLQALAPGEETTLSALEGMSPIPQEGAGLTLVFEDGSALDAALLAGEGEAGYLRLTDDAGTSLYAACDIGQLSVLQNLVNGAVHTFTGGLGPNEFNSVALGGLPAGPGRREAAARALLEGYLRLFGATAGVAGYYRPLGAQGVRAVVTAGDDDVFAARLSFDLRVQGNEAGRSYFESWSGQAPQDGVLHCQAGMRVAAGTWDGESCYSIVSLLGGEPDERELAPIAEAKTGRDYRGLDTAFKAEESLTQREAFYLRLVTGLDLCGTDPTLTFAGPALLDDKAKYLFFRFITAGFLDSLEEGGTSLEETLTNPETGLVEVPVPLIRTYLADYLGTSSFDPARAFAGERRRDPDTGAMLGYDPARDVYTCYMLSGFGGVRTPGLLACESLGDNTYRVVVGMYDSEKAYSLDPPVWELFRTDTLVVREDPADRRRFTILSFVYTSYDEYGGVATLARPQYYEERLAPADSREEGMFRALAQGPREAAQEALHAGNVACQTPWGTQRLERLDRLYAGYLSGHSNDTMFLTNTADSPPALYQVGVNGAGDGFRIARITRQGPESFETTAYPLGRFTRTQEAYTLESENGEIVFTLSRAPYHPPG